METNAVLAQMVMQSLSPRTRTVRARRRRPTLRVPMPRLTLRRTRVPARMAECHG
jgi:hypothetical protein